MSHREFCNCLDGWRELEEMSFKAGWERARYIAKAIVSVNVGKKDRAKLDQAFELPWDHEGGGRTRKLAYSLEELEAMEAGAERTAERMNKQLKNGISGPERKAGADNEKF